MRMIPLLLGLVLALAACGSAGGDASPSPRPSPDPSGDPSPGASLAVISGGEWRAVSVAGRTPIGTHVPTIAFEDGRISGSTGCNSYGGQAVVDGPEITVSEVVQTEMACMEPGVMDLEAAFTVALSQATSIAVVDGRLVIAGPGGELVFVRPG